MKISNFNLYDNLIGYSLFFLSVISSLLSVFFSLSNSSPREGLEYLFIIPIIFFILILLFHKVYFVAYRSFSFPILFIMLIVRFAVSPALIYITKELHFTRMIPDENSYEMAIIFSLFELFIVFFAIHFFYKSYNKEKFFSPISFSNSSYSDNKATHYLQIIIVFILSIFLIARSSNFFEGLYFLIPNDSYFDSGAYEGIVFLALKTFIFLKVLIFTKSQKRFQFFFFVFAIIFLLVNVSLSYGNNRSLIIINFLASIFVFNKTYPKQSRLLMILLIPIISSFILSLIFFKQFGDNLSLILNFDIPLQKLSEDIEMYVNGMWPLASSFQLIRNGLLSNNNFFVQIYVDFVKNFFPFLIPGFNLPVLIVSDFNTTAAIYNFNTNNIGAMFPLAGQIVSYFGFPLGFIVDMFAHFFFVKLLIRYEFLSFKSNSIELSYYYNWLSLLFAFMMNYSLIIFVWSWSKNVLLIFLLIMVGRFFDLKLRLKK